VATSQRRQGQQHGLLVCQQPNHLLVNARRLKVYNQRGAGFNWRWHLAQATYAQHSREPQATSHFCCSVDTKPKGPTRRQIDRIDPFRGDGPGRVITGQRHTPCTVLVPAHAPRIACARCIGWRLCRLQETDIPRSAHRRVPSNRCAHPLRCCWSGGGRHWLFSSG